MVAELRTGSVQIGGRDREFLIAVPDDCSHHRRCPIIVMLHGGMGSPALIADQSGLVEYVERDRFIAVFPAAGDRPWNDGRAHTHCAENDVAFLTTLVRHVAIQYGGDPKRAFLAGASNGGMMTQHVACQAAGTFRAYAVVQANLPAELVQHPPSRPVPILFILSRDDPRMPWNGGKIPGRRQIGAAGRLIGAGGRVLSAPDSVDFFARANHCEGQETTEMHGSGDGGDPVRIHMFRGGGSPVILYELFGAGHGWPGSRTTRYARTEQLFGPVSQILDATKVILGFFKQDGFMDLAHHDSKPVIDTPTPTQNDSTSQAKDVTDSLKRSMQYTQFLGPPFNPMHLALQETSCPPEALLQRIGEVKYQIELLQALLVMLNEQLQRAPTGADEAADNNIPTSRG